VIIIFCKRLEVLLQHCIELNTYIIDRHSDAEMITYSDGSASDAFSLAITYDTAFYSGGTVANWGSANRHSNRLYAVLAVVTASERILPF
jgi:hypothetical protein